MLTWHDNEEWMGYWLQHYLLATSVNLVLRIGY